MPDALASAERMAAGFDKSPLAYFLALSILANFVLALAVYRELKGSTKTAEKLGGVLEQHNQAARELGKAVDFVLAQAPRKRPPLHHEEPPPARAIK